MGRRTANQPMQIASGVVTRPLCCDEGREVHLIEVFADDGSKIALAMKYWGPDRLAGGDMTDQVFNELRARMSILSSCYYTVLPLHVNISKEGGMLMLYPDAGTSMDTVCARVRAAGKAAALETQLAEMATSVLLTLQKLQAQKPKAWVHRDVKLENLLLGEDGLVRLADFGSRGDVGDTSTAHDPTYFPPDWAALLPDGRHVFEDAASLAAVNTHVLDLRGLGMALIKGWAGYLPAEVDLNAAGQFSTSSSSLGSTSVSPISTPCGSLSSLDSVSTTSNSCAEGLFDAQERARLLRIAQHDWQASIDVLIPQAAASALNQFAKLLMGPREAVLPLSKLLQQPLIKAVHRKVLDTARKARKPWMAHVASCRTVAWRVLAPLMQLEQQLLQVYSDGTLSTTPPLSEQFELLAEQHQEQQGAAADIAALARNCSSGCSLLMACPSHSSSARENSEAMHAGSDAILQDSLSAVLAQLAAARPHAACRVAQLHEELLQLVAGAGVLSSFEPVQPYAAILPGSPVGPNGCGMGVQAPVPVQQEGDTAAGQLMGGAHLSAASSKETVHRPPAVAAPSAGQSAGAAVQDTLPDLSTPKIIDAVAAAFACAGSFGAQGVPPCNTATRDPLTAGVTTLSNSPLSWLDMQQSQLFVPSSMLDADPGQHGDQQTLYLPPLSIALDAGCEEQRYSQHNRMAPLPSPRVSVMGSYEPVQPSNHRVLAPEKAVQEPVQQDVDAAAGQLMGWAVDSDQYTEHTHGQDILNMSSCSAASHSADYSAGVGVQDALPDHSDVDPTSDAACKGLNADAWCTDSRQKPSAPAAATISCLEGMAAFQLEGCQGAGVSGSSIGGFGGGRACLPMLELDSGVGTSAAGALCAACLPAAGFELRAWPLAEVGDDACLGVDVSTAACQVGTSCSSTVGAVRRRRGVVGLCGAACRAMRHWAVQG